MTPILDADLDYAPREGMKSYRAQLKEIGAMEAATVIILSEGRIPEWSESESHMTGENVAELLGSLNQIRSKMLAYLDTADDNSLAQTIPIPQEWWEWMGGQEIEAEEFVRWIARHEYYHLGQIVAYRWIQGHDPYKKGVT